MNSFDLRRACYVLLACLTLALAACGGDDDDSGDSGNDAPAATQAETVEQTAPASEEADPDADEELLELGSTYNAAFNKFKARLTTDVRGGDLSAAQATTAQFRTAVAEYDAGLREIEVGTENQPQANTILGKSRTVISGLDSMSQATDLASFRRLLFRVYEDNKELIAENNELANALN